jgi:antitoxin component YwqK of YwqJK toxin-antitoxin module
MIYSIGKRITNFIKLRIYKFDRRSGIGQDVRKVKDGDTTCEHKKWYYDSGALKAETIYINGKLEGIANYYYESGDIKAREFYVNDQLHGLSKWYYTSGEVKSERYYKLGTLVSRREYDKAGRMIRAEEG